MEESASSSQPAATSSRATSSARRRTASALSATSPAWALSAWAAQTTTRSAARGPVRPTSSPSTPSTASSAKLSAGNGNVIRGNSIHDNGGLGIDLLGAVGPSANDPGDADGGANDLQNFPIIQSVEHLGPQGAAAPASSESSTARPSTTFDLDFYSNPACSNFPREFIEGETYLGSSQVTTDGNGNAAFDVTLPSRPRPAPASRPRPPIRPATRPSSRSGSSSRSPRSPGPDTGGTAFTVSGTDFADPTTVIVGGVPATGVTFTNDHALGATMPAFRRAPPRTSSSRRPTEPRGL